MEEEEKSPSIGRSWEGKKEEWAAKRSQYMDGTKVSHFWDLRYILLAHTAVKCSDSSPLPSYVGSQLWLAEKLLTDSHIVGSSTCITE